jgi:LacI family transcriptional regulator
VVVEYDNDGGAFAATSHLLSAGHERILCLGRHPGYTTAESRLSGYRRALAAHRVPHDPALEVEGTMEWHEGHRMMRQRLAAAAGTAVSAVRPAATRTAAEATAVGRLVRLRVRLRAGAHMTPPCWKVSRHRSWLFLDAR